MLGHEQKLQQTSLSEVNCEIKSSRIKVCVQYVLLQYTLYNLISTLTFTILYIHIVHFLAPTSCCLLCSSFSRSSRACLLFLSSSAFFFASSSPDLAKFSNLALIFLAPSEPEFEKLPGVKIYYSKNFFYKKVRLLHMKTWSGVHMQVFFIYGGDHTIWSWFQYNNFLNGLY